MGVLRALATADDAPEALPAPPAEAYVDAPHSSFSRRYAYSVLVATAMS